MAGNNKRLARKAYGVKWSWTNRGKILWKELVEKQNEYKIKVT